MSRPSLAAALARHYRRFPPAGRLAAYLGGVLALAGLYCVLLAWIFRPGPDVWSAPARYPLLQNLYLLGAYGLLMGGAALCWRQLQGESWRALGLDAPAAMARPALWGLVFGWASLGLLFAVEVACGLVQWDAAAWARATPWDLLAFGASALFFGASEEWLFRGFVLRTLRRGHGAALAIAGSAAFYATVHFLRFDLHFAAIALPWAGLFGAGCLLGWLALRTRSLALGTGLHVGWVSLFLWSDRQHGVIYPAAHNWLTGGGYPLGGVLGLVLLALLAGAFAFWPRAPRRFGAPVPARPSL